VVRRRSECREKLLNGSSVTLAFMRAGLAREKLSEYRPRKSIIAPIRNVDGDDQKRKCQDQTGMNEHQADCDVDGHDNGET
jgi:hypothetical protein